MKPSEETPVSKVKNKDKSSPKGSPKSFDLGTPHSPRITIKPIVKPQNYSDDQREDSNEDSSPVEEPEMIDFEEEIKERIVLKLNRNQKASPTEKLDKIKVKLSKEGGHPTIIGKKRGHDAGPSEVEDKRAKTTTDDPNVILIEDDDSKQSKRSSDDEDVEFVEDPLQLPSCSHHVPAAIEDPLVDIPVFKINANASPQGMHK